MDSPSSWSSRSPQRPLSTCLENHELEVLAELACMASTPDGRERKREEPRPSILERSARRSRGEPADGNRTGDVGVLLGARRVSAGIRSGCTRCSLKLGESGVPGLLLISGFIFGVIGFGIRRAFAAPLDTRPWIAAATAACIAFATAAAVDWAWEMALIPIVFLLLVAAILAVRDPKEDGSPNAQGPRPRIVLGVLGVLALAAIGIPLIGTEAVRASQDDVNAGEVDSALEQARTAGNVEPWAATPPLQQALVLELQGDLGAAAEQARQATRREPTNWRTWYTLSRIEEAQGDREAARAAFRRARELNPRSALFSR